MYKRQAKKWDIRSLFPGNTDAQIANKVADYFNAISSKFVPLTEDGARVSEDYPEIMPFQIAGRLRAVRKPKNQVPGDILPFLVTLYSNILAIPPAIIFNLITRTGQWPASWSTEIVTIIPKNNDPANITEC